MATSTDILNVADSRTGNSHFHCCVPGCKGDGRYDKSLRFHHIPKDKDRRKKWIVKIRRDVGKNFRISNSTVVCSRHFLKEDYRAWGPVKKNLKKDAVPSLFSWSGMQVEGRRKNGNMAAHENDQNEIEGRRKTRNMPVHDNRNKNGHKQSRKLASHEDNKNESVESVHGDQEENEVGDEQNCDKSEKNLKRKITELKEQLRETTEQNSLHEQLKLEQFGLNRFSNDDAMINFYTGFPTYCRFITFFQCMQSSAKKMQISYCMPMNTANVAAGEAIMSIIDQMFMFFCRLHAGLFEQDLSVRFNVSVTTVNRTIMTWANFLYIVLGAIPIWLPRDVVKQLMPACFQTTYPQTRVILDYIELKTQQPSPLVSNSRSYSNYTSLSTLKCLLGFTPHGSVSFVSSLYPGSVSDVEVSALCGLLDLLEGGDEVMAGKRFTPCKKLTEKKVTLNRPHFLSCDKQLAINDVGETEQIAQLRAHVEIMKRRVKDNRLFDCPLPVYLSGSVNQLWSVACLLANFKGPIVHD